MSTRPEVLKHALLHYYREIDTLHSLTITLVEGSKDLILPCDTHTVKRAIKIKGKCKFALAHHKQLADALKTLQYVIASNIKSRKSEMIILN